MTHMYLPLSLHDHKEEEKKEIKCTQVHIEKRHHRKELRTKCLYTVHTHMHACTTHAMVTTVSSVNRNK